MPRGGKPPTGSAVYFSITPREGHNKFTTECLCCGTTWQYKMTGTKQVAHLLAITDQSVPACKFTIKQLPDGARESLSMSTKAAREDTAKSVKKLGFGKPGDQAERPAARGIKRLFGENHATNADLLLAHAVAVHGGVAWRFCNSPGFVEFAAYLARNPMPDYKPAHRNKLSGRTFDALIARQDQDVEAADDKSQWSTIYSDGYETKQHRHTLNSLAATREGTRFLNSRHVTIDEGGSLNKEQMTMVVAEDIAAVGEKRVSSYVLDSPNVNIGTLKDMELEFPSICGILCQTHQFSLVISKILKLTKYKQQVQAALLIAKLFRRVLFLKALFSALQFSSELKSTYPNAPKDDGYAILLFAKTRMGGVFFMLKRLIFLKPALQAAVISTKFTEKYGEELAQLEAEAEAAEVEQVSSDDEMELNPSGSAAKEKRKMQRILSAKKYILNEEWWLGLEKTCSLLSVLVDKMKETDHRHFLTGKMRDMWLKGQACNLALAVTLAVSYSYPYPHPYPEPSL